MDTYALHTYTNTHTWTPMHYITIPIKFEDGLEDSGEGRGRTCWVFEHRWTMEGRQRRSQSDAHLATEPHKRKNTQTKRNLSPVCFLQNRFQQVSHILRCHYSTSCRSLHNMMRQSKVLAQRGYFWSPRLGNWIMFETSVARQVRIPIYLCIYIYIHKHIITFSLFTYSWNPISAVPIIFIVPSGPRPHGPPSGPMGSK